MKIFYFTDIYIKGFTGKEKGTRVKIESFRKILKSDFEFFTPKYKFKSIFLRVFYYLFCDMILCFNIFIFYRNYVIYERSSFFIITNFCIRFFRLNVFTEIHADEAEELNLLFKPYYQKRIISSLWKLKKVFLRQNTGIVYNHPYLRRHFKNVFFCPSISVYNGADTVAYFPKEIMNSRIGLDLPLNKIICLFLGSGSKWHGIDYVISIFNTDIFSLRDDICLLVVGPPKNRRIELEDKCKGSNVFFVGEVDNSIAMEYINASNICLLPVKSNRVSPGSPIKLYDYAACGKPIVAQRDLHGYSDEVLNHELGIVIDYTNALKSSIELLDFINNYNPNQYLRNNRLKAVTNINVDNRIHKTIDFFSSLTCTDTLYS